MKKYSTLQVITFLAGILGFLIGIIPFLGGYLLGTGIEFTKARATNEFARSLQPHAATIFWILTILIFIKLGFLGFLQVYHKKKGIWLFHLNFSNIFKYVRIIIAIGVGYLFYELAIYLLINSIYYHNAFITIPYLIGTGIVAGMMILVLTDISFLSFIYHFIVKTPPKMVLERKNPLNYLKLMKNVGCLSLGLIFLLPTIAPMAGFYPSPNFQPVQGYGSPERPYSVSKIQIENVLPSDIASYVLPDNENSSWYSYIYLPNFVNETFTTTPQIPIAFYLHGYGGSYHMEYDTSLRTLASRGVAVIFVQYATNLNVDAILANLDNANTTNGPDYYVRYNMTWNGMSLAVNALTGNNSLISEETLSGILGGNYHFDLSRIMVIGHSYGGGMTIFMGPQIINQGWASNQLVIDLEAPWYTTTWADHQPDLSILPNYTIVNVVGYEDDSTASPCIGMHHFERYLSRDNSTPLNSDQVSYLYIQSDRYGFPRLVATHYLPTDALINTLTNYGYFRRIDAMAGFLIANAMNDTATALDAQTYFTQGNSNMVNLGEWSDGTPIKPLIYSIDPYGKRGGVNLAALVLNPDHEMCQE